jgi:uncharacterized protein
VTLPPQTRPEDGAPSGDPSGAGALVDCDVHVTWRTADDLAAHLPREWHNRLRSGRGAPRIQPAFYLPFRGPHAGVATPTEGGPAGSDPQTTGRDWLDRQGIAYAVLTSPDVPVISTWGDTDYPVALARAYNSWLIERWLSADRRFRGSLVVATQDPPAAAAEIDRAGAHPQVVQVLLSSGTRLPYGDPSFLPIYEAAARNGLHLALHTGTEGLGTSNPPTPAGWPSYAMEWRAGQAHNLSAHLVSLVTAGVFVRFPALKVVLLDGGAAWLPQLLWRLDKNFKPMRSECPWLTEMPSAYLKRHVRFGTQGLERPDDPQHLWTYLRLMDGEQSLLYASGYPRWDMEAPGDTPVLRSAPPPARRRIETENARRLYNLPLS